MNCLLQDTELAKVLFVLAQTMLNIWCNVIYQRVSASHDISIFKG
jgi:hypothetical protein